MSLASPKAMQANSKVLARNTVFNFGGQTMVALVAVILVPLVVRALGHESYGLLSLALTVFGSFNLLELGLGRTTTKFVAEYLGRGELDRLGSVIWTSFGLQVFIGVFEGALLAMAAPFLASRVFNVPVQLVEETQTMLFILAFSAPVVLGSSALRGALEGAQRFDLVNAIKVALNVSTYVVPLVGAQINIGITGIVLLMLVVRVIATIAYLLCCLWTFPSIRTRLSFDIFCIPFLFSYAGWIALSNLIVPFLVQLDRYLIASLVSVEAVTFYSVPFEILNGLWIIPSAIAMVLLPAFSSLQAKGNKNLADLYMRATKYIFAILGPLVLIMITFSHELLLYWQGPSFAERSALALQILLAGAFVNSLAYMPLNLLLGIGFPDLPAKLNLLELPVYLLSAYFLISKHGIVGASIAFTIRVALDAALLFMAAWSLAPSTRQTFAYNKLRFAFALLLLFGLGLWGIRSLPGGLLIKGVLASALLIFYTGLVLYKVLDNTDRRVLFTLLRSESAP